MMVIEVTEELAFSQGLKGTICQVEFAIVQTAKRLLVRESKETEGPDSETKGIARVCKALGTGHARGVKHYKGKCPQCPKMAVEQAPRIKDSDLIYKVTEVQIFSQSLVTTIRDVERAIIRLACIRCGCNKRAVCRALRTGKGRVRKYFYEIEQELKRSGCPLPKSNGSDAFIRVH